ncbi:MAG: hypothetical protein M1607_01670 [Patescibacteria group bacterium]|nr:hypothetical protein [Patescibacteria group bacterium]
MVNSRESIEVASLAARELRKYLGLRVKPVLRKIDVKSDSRGEYDSDRNVMTVNGNDPFAELHEITHSLTHHINPDLWSEIATFRLSKPMIDKIALFALYEGIAQWVAITVGLATQDPSRMEEASRERDKLLPVDSSLGTIRKVAQEFTDSLWLSRGMSFQDFQAGYVFALERVYNEAMSLGYVYADSRFSELTSQQPRLTVSRKFTLVIQDPPVFTRLVEEVASK